MKKFFAFFTILFVAVAASFADSVVKSSDLNNPWVVGKWTMAVKMSAMGQQESVTAKVDIKGYKDSSEVILSAEGEEDEVITLEEFKEGLFEELTEQFPLDEDALKEAADQGITITGDTNWHINTAKTKMTFALKASMEGMDVIDVSVTLTKN